MAGGIVNIDSERELSWLRELNSEAVTDNRVLKAGIRVNVNLRNWVNEIDGIELGDYHGGRFGFCYENGELKRAADSVRDLSNVRITGLHMHQSLPSRAPAAFGALARAAVEVADSLKIDVEYIDMGGGYFGGRDDCPSFDDYFAVISAELRKAFDPDKVKLIAEPGVSLVSRGFTLTTTVTDVKHIEGNIFLMTDGSRLYLNPQVTRHVYPHHLILQDDSERSICSSQWVTGSTCMEYDRLFEISDYKELKAGDKVVYDCAGGYTMCLAPMFINYFPAIYVTRKDGELLTARKRWTNRELLQGTEY